MKKELTIEGMMCEHCKTRVEKALSALEGVTKVIVSLEEKKAIIEITKEIEEKILKDTVEDLGYMVISIS